MTSVPLNFHPHPGTIVICDFSTGFRPPEMVKARPVVVISPRRRASGIVTVVPLSSTAPSPVEPWHYQLPPGLYPLARRVMWAKCDMVTAVSLNRLDRVRSKNSAGQRTHATYQIGPADLAAILGGVRAALGF
jgi:mRNA interferase MazF